MYKWQLSYSRYICWWRTKTHLICLEEKRETIRRIEDLRSSCRSKVRDPCSKAFLSDPRSHWGMQCQTTHQYKTWSTPGFRADHESSGNSDDSGYEPSWEGEADLDHCKARGGLWMMPEERWHDLSLLPPDWKRAEHIGGQKWQSLTVWWESFRSNGK
jgi:hypothetical protein